MESWGQLMGVTSRTRLASYPRPLSPSCHAFSKPSLGVAAREPLCTCSLSVLWVLATSVCSLGPFPSSLSPSIFITPECSLVSEAHVFLPLVETSRRLFFLLKIRPSDLSRSQVVNKTKITCVLDYLSYFLYSCWSGIWGLDLGQSASPRASNS